jgi:hypothetical protein
MCEVEHGAWESQRASRAHNAMACDNNQLRAAVERSLLTNAIEMPIQLVVKDGPSVRKQTMRHAAQRSMQRPRVHAGRGCSDLAAYAMRQKS